MDEPPNNPLKLPFFVVCAAIGIVALVIGVMSAAWGLVLLGAVLVAGTFHAIKIVRDGRNPRWLRSPLDSWWARRTR